MKKGFRGGAGQGPKKSKGKSGSNDRSEAGSQGRDFRTGKNASGGRKKRSEIKNARGLRDVLGMGSGSSSTGDARFRRPERGPEPRPKTRPEQASSSESDGGRAIQGTQSKKLTYIMSFQPPSEAKSTSGEQRRQSTGESMRQGRAEPAERSRQSHKRDSDSWQKPSKQIKNNTKSSRQQAGGLAEKQSGGLFRKPSGPKSNASSIVPDKARASSQVDRSHGRSGARLVQGIVKRHPDGYGFLIVDEPDTPDVYVPRHSMGGIMTNDRIEVELFKPRSRGKEERLSGEVTRILVRANRRVVGRFLAVDQKYGIIQDDGRGWGADLRIATKDSMDAKDGEMVAVDVLQFPDHDREFVGRVVDIIGDVEDPVNDVIRVVHQSGIPLEFSKEAIGDARRFGGQVADAERQGREDITDLPICTIDGTTARDFDDAIYVETHERGFRLVVAIADVSHYVKPGTQLDQEAYERGTSTYFPNFVVPMLPEELSNELCSLKPFVARLCFCCEMTIDWQGEIIDYRFFEGVMQSKARVTYGEAQEVVDGGDLVRSRGRDPRLLPAVEENIRRAADLAKILMAKRFREGSLDLEIPETQVVVDETGETTDIIRSERLFAHRLIEELMLATNICTARFLDEANIPGIYRVHEEPDPENIRALQRYLWNLGGSRSVMGDNLAKKLTKALESMADKPEAQILNILTLRTMQQAHYSQDNVGHFGLGFSHYSHFTSPIRRYPDLIAHRIIKSQLYSKYHSMQLSEEDIASASTWLSACEQRSVKAERKVVSIKKARFMRRFEGQEFDGIISSVAKFGVFVLLRQYDVDGLVKIENLGNDRFLFDEDNLRLIGSRSGLRYVIGDSVRVRVASSNPEDGRIEFVLANEHVSIHDQKSSQQDEFDFDPNDIGDKEPAGGIFKGRKQVERKDGKAKRLGHQKRGTAANDRRGVRKERVSKRRRKD
jgi:ribonuclease R